MLLPAGYNYACIILISSLSQSMLNRLWTVAATSNKCTHLLNPLNLSTQLTGHMADLFYVRSIFPLFTQSTD